VTPGCPPDLTAPIPAVTCTDEREPTDGKFSAQTIPVLVGATTPIEVEITVAGGATICPLPKCSTPPCPAAEAVTEWMMAVNLSSQRCVRDLIRGLGGTSDPASEWLVDSFRALLTWDQIQAVAGYPQVTDIEPDEQLPPP
jgi:hypothetical protein